MAADGCSSLSSMETVATGRVTERGCGCCVSTQPGVCCSPIQRRERVRIVTAQTFTSALGPGLISLLTVCVKLRSVWQMTWPPRSPFAAALAVLPCPAPPGLSCPRAFAQQILIVHRGLPGGGRAAGRSERWKPRERGLGSRSQLAAGQRAGRLFWAQVKARALCRGAEGSTGPSELPGWERSRVHTVGLAPGAGFQPQPQGRTSGAFNPRPTEGAQVCVRGSHAAPP